MGQKAESWYKKKKGEKNRKYLIGWDYIVNFGVRKSKEISIQPRVGPAHGHWLTGYVLLGKWNVYRLKNVI